MVFLYKFTILLLVVFKACYCYYYLPHVVKILIKARCPNGVKTEEVFLENINGDVFGQSKEIEL